MSTATTSATAPPALALLVAERLPHRAGNPWTAAPYQAWWSLRPAARLSQAGRPGALILVPHTWHTEIAFQLNDREPYEPDLRLDRMAPDPVAREILRLVLPLLDDAAAVTYASRAGDAERARLRHLNLIGEAVRAHGAVTRNHLGDDPNSHGLSWETAGVQYTATLVGANPAVNLSVTGPVRAVETALPLFLDEPPARTPRRRVRGVTTRLGRRLAAALAPFTTVDRLDDGGLTVGGATGPFGYIAPPADPYARVRDTSPVSAELHGVGIDHLVRLAPFLTR
ncbi:hypothetical protein ACWD4V_01180 [Streptomyces tsukubensis]